MVKGSFFQQCGQKATAKTSFGQKDTDNRTMQSHKAAFEKQTPIIKMYAGLTVSIPTVVSAKKRVFRACNIEKLLIKTHRFYEAQMPERTSVVGLKCAFSMNEA